MHKNTLLFYFHSIKFSIHFILLTKILPNFRLVVMHLSSKNVYIYRVSKQFINLERLISIEWSCIYSFLSIWTAMMMMNIVVLYKWKCFFNNNKTFQVIPKKSWEHTIRINASWECTIDAIASKGSIVVKSLW